jgi:hypothetical protein
LSKAFSAVLIALLVVSASVGIAFTAKGTESSVALSSPVELQNNLAGEYGYSVFQLADGSLVLNTANQSCTFLVKLDSSDHLLWTKPIRIDQKSTVLPRLLPTHDGGYVLAGIVDNMYTLVKTDSQGKVQWTKMFSSGAPINYFMSIIQTSDGGFAVAGFGETIEEGLGWIWFAKTDSSGNMEWNETISGPVADCPSSIIQTSGGGYVISDTSYSFAPSQGFFTLIKIDANGNVLGNTTYGGEGYYFQPECNFAVATKDDGYLIGGFLWEKSAWIVKTDAEGKMQWNQTYGESGSSISGALETQGGGYLLLVISNQKDVGLMMTDKTGYELWNMSFPGVTLPLSLEANFNSIINAKGGGYIIIGSKNQSVWLAKLDYQYNRSIAFQLTSITDIAFVVAMLILATLTVSIFERRKRTKSSDKNLRIIFQKSTEWNLNCNEVESCCFVEYLHL